MAGRGFAMKWQDGQLLAALYAARREILVSGAVERRSEICMCARLR